MRWRVWRPASPGDRVVAASRDVSQERRQAEFDRPFSAVDDAFGRPAHGAKATAKACGTPTVQRFAKFPVIVVTASGRYPELKREYGLAGHFEKPIDLGDLVDAVDACS